MITALLIAALLSGEPAKKCITACFYKSDGIGYECFYDERQSCGTARECVDSKEIRCTPRVKLLWIENYVTGG